MDNNQFSRQQNNKSLAAVLKEKGLVASVTEAEEMARNINNTDKKVTQNLNEYKAQMNSTNEASQVREGSGLEVEQILRQFGSQLGEQLQHINARMDSLEGNMGKVVSQLQLVIDTMNTYFSQQQPIIQQQTQMQQPTVHVEQSMPMNHGQSQMQAQQAAPASNQFQAASVPDQPKQQKGINGMDPSEYDINKYFYSGSKPQ